MILWIRRWKRRRSLGHFSCASSCVANQFHLNLLPQLPQPSLHVIQSHGSETGVLMEVELRQRDDLVAILVAVVMKVAAFVAT